MAEETASKTGDSREVGGWGADWQRGAARLPGPGGTERLLREGAAAGALGGDQPGLRWWEARLSCGWDQVMKDFKCPAKNAALWSVGSVFKHDWRHVMGALGGCERGAGGDSPVQERPGQCCCRSRGHAQERA